LPECLQAYEALGHEEEVYRSYSADLNDSLGAGPDVGTDPRGNISGCGSGTDREQGFLRAARNAFPGQRFARYATFAAVVACVSIAGTLVAVKMFSPLQPIVAGNPPLSQNSLEAALQSVQRAEVEYIQAIGLLSEIVERQKGMLEPVRRAEVENHLKSLDDEIARARQAYHSHPLDAELGSTCLRLIAKRSNCCRNLPPAEPPYGPVNE